MKAITIKGAREHNLKNINLKLPRNTLIVITGLSGSGKSSLAFDTIYTEGQRRYLESVSSYARQFLNRMKKADVDYISGLSPTISIEQRQISKNPRSTVGTVTEIYDYLRLLFAKTGEVSCYQCGSQVARQEPEEMLASVYSLKKGTPLSFYAPLVRGRKGIYRDLLLQIKKKGFTRVRIDAVLHDLSEKITLKKNVRHTIDVLVDRIKNDERNKAQIGRSLATALAIGKGVCVVRDEEKEQEWFFSETMTCPQCAISFSEFTPNMFSFNSPYGACAECHGLGKTSRVISKYIIKDETKPLLSGALNRELYAVCNKYTVEELVFDVVRDHHCDINAPYADLPLEVKDALFWGTDSQNGLLDELRDQLEHGASSAQRNNLKKFVHEEVCPSCGGARIKKESLGVAVGGKTIAELSALSLDALKVFLEELTVPRQKKIIAEAILKEIRERTAFLVNIGVGYLSLDRTVATLGGGELQRIKLGSQIGVGLSGVLYVLDEPSIGLHPRDTHKLLNALCTLRDLRNTVIVVEHDEETIRRADYVIDLGPGAGALGGAVVGEGPLPVFMKKKKSITAAYLSRKKTIPLPKKRKPYHDTAWLEIKNARAHNLKGIDVGIPLGLFTCITGVSGSGKSTLMHDTLCCTLHNKHWKTHYVVGVHDAIVGDEGIDKIIEIDQSPIGRTPRSNPATYCDVFAHIRKLFASLPESRLRNYTQGRFSFNVKGGRCESCRGAGWQKLEMSFLPDVYVMCDVCQGKQYNDSTLEVMYKGKTIHDVLDLSIEEACELFAAIPQIQNKLKVLCTIGLGYVKLGQSSTTLSGGEAQRVKLAAELSKKATGKTLYILDEPTTGLHFHDVHNLLKALLYLRDQGNTVVIIEHNIDVIKMADYIIDLGPEGGDGGGFVVGTGTPEEIARNKKSYTGVHLKNYLK